MYFFHVLLFFLLGTSVIASPAGESSLPSPGKTWAPAHHRRISELRGDRITKPVRPGKPGDRGSAGSRLAAILNPSTPRNKHDNKYAGMWYQVLAFENTARKEPPPAYANFVVMDIQEQVTLYKLGPKPGEILAGGIPLTRNLQCLLPGIWHWWPSSNVPTERRRERLIIRLDTNGNVEFVLDDSLEVKMLKSKPELRPLKNRGGPPLPYIADRNVFYRIPTADAFEDDKDQVIRIHNGLTEDPDHVSLYKRPSKHGDSLEHIKDLPRTEWYTLVGSWDLMPSSSIPMNYLRDRLFIKMEPNSKQLQFKYQPA